MTSKEIKDLYVKLEQREHIYKLPDTYIGSADCTTESMYVLDENKKMKLTEVEYVPGLYKILDELIVNAWDQKIRLDRRKTEPNVCPVKNIRISIDQESGLFTIYNDGEGIDVAIHPEYKTWIVQMIFGQLLTSTNYNPDEDNTTGGKNGYGAKLANVFSKRFTVDTVDRMRKLRYYQVFEENMTIIRDPEISTDLKGIPYTQITLVPDFGRFGLSGWSNNMIKIIEKRAYELSACMDDVNVYFNNTKIEVKNFEKFMDYFSENVEGKVFEKCNERWDVGVTLSDGFKQVSFVNGICTLKGGKHVEYIVNQITKKVVENIEKKKKIKVKPSYVKDNLMVFVKCLIVNPSFDSQTKETLTTQVAKFGSKCEVSENFINKVLKGGLVERVLKLHEAKQTDTLKSENKRRNKVLGIDKLEDANEAGGVNSQKCTLVLTEGDSAKGTAVAGIEVVGRDYWGVFPLKGKIINARDKSNTLKGKEQLMENKELNNLQKILGLVPPTEIGKTYTDLSSLRYGRVMLMTDQDVDGSHIKGLFINWIDTFWPELIDLGFITCILTPIIKLKKGKQNISFYTIGDFIAWKSNNDMKGWELKYYKGLGTSNSTEAKEYFSNLKQVKFRNDDVSRERLDLAFNKTRADDRKLWLGEYDIDKVLNINNQDVTIREFVDFELKHFSNYDLHRSVGHLLDGNKPSQRKILYACFKRNLYKEIKVAQLAGYVSEHTGYHHGEESLNKAIVGMAQDFIGSNNLNLLLPNGQFGTRLEGGKDHASSRYIFTCLNPIVKYLFPEDDFPLLEYLDDDGVKVEPRFYVPILPTVLINGNCGVGTAYSTDIPCFNPIDIAQEFLKKLSGGSFAEIHPHYNNFQGSIKRLNTNTYLTKGLYKITSYKTVDILELPVGVWTNDYKTFLETLIQEKPSDQGKCLKNYKNYCTESKIHFVLEFIPEVLKEWVKDSSTDENVNTFEKNLKLTSKLSLSNMHLFNTSEVINKFDSSVSIMNAFYDVRYSFYVKRRDYLLQKLKKDMKMLENKVRFVTGIITDKIIVHKKSKVELNSLLEDLLFDKYSSSEDGNPTFDYLISMPIYNLTTDNVESLKLKLEEKMKQLQDLENKTVEMIWSEEIQNFLSQYKAIQKSDIIEVKKVKKITVKSSNS
jgi:DNA topoisomerase-2